MNPEENATAPSRGRRQSSQPARTVCVVSEIEFGSTVTTDPGSATYALAQHLAALGDNVTLLWVPSPTGADPDEKEIERLAKWCFDNFLVRLELLPPSPELISWGRESSKNSVAVYHYLKQHSFDIVYFSLEGGLAHFPTVAKRTGVFPNPPVIVVLAHEPLLWRLEANADTVDRKEQMTVAHMERTSAQTCDHLVVSGKSLLSWMSKAGWKLPKSHQVIAPLTPREWRSNFMLGNYTPRQRPTTEIVHLSGTEVRSGLPLLCDALDVLADSGLTDLTVTVIGAFGPVLGEHSGGLIIRRGRLWPFKVKLLPIRSEADIYEYVRQRHALVTITHSAAHVPLDVVTCLDEAIPFIATDVGSVRELLHPNSAAAALMEPTAKSIAARIAAVVQAPSFAPPVPVQKRDARDSAWDKLHSRLVNRPAKSSSRKPTRKPLVSIITAHYNRARLLPQAVASVRRQDYPNIELIVVDDGSTDPDAIKLLSELEPEFKQRGWRIIRQENGFLGKARNNGIRSAKGSLILFLDDDNALFPNAVSTFVAGIQNSGADICTTFAKWLNEPYVPPSTSGGHMIYFPVGGPTDIALITNPYGDANAIFRREVFDKIGFLNEERGFSASDWEFFLRADMGGLEIVNIPEPLYWYRSAPDGMNRNAEWVRNRKPIIEVFKKHKFENISMFLDLGIKSNIPSHEKQLNLWNLELRVKDDRYIRLSAGPAGSSDAIKLLAEIAAREGRADTAISLLGHTGLSDFTSNVAAMLKSGEGDATPELYSALSRELVIGSEAMRLAIVSSYPQSGSDTLAYIEQSPDQLFLEAKGSAITMALFKGVCSSEFVRASAMVSLVDEYKAHPIEVQLVALDSEGMTASDLVAKLESEGAWSGISRLHQPREIEMSPFQKESRPDLLLAIRCIGRLEAASALASIYDIKVVHVVASGSRHPRMNAPLERQRTRRLTRDDLKRAVLATNYPSQLPLLLIDKGDGGIFLRPHEKGPVIATLDSAFPSYARSVVATVEIAHDEASPFEFAMALARPEDVLNWKGDRPSGALSFSGWTRVTRPFELHEIRLTIDQIDRKWMTIHLAIRLPRGSKPMPSNAFWRKFVIVWD